MSQVRFLHVFPSFEAGGAQLRVCSIINYMGPGAGHAILALDGNLAAGYRLREECAVPVRVGPKKNNPLQFILSLRRQIRELGPRVLLTYNWGATDALIGARLDRFQPVIHNECGLSNEFDGERRRRALARRFLLNGIYRTVVVSQTMQRIALNRFGVQPDKVTWIQTGVDIEKFRPWRNEELRRQIDPGPGGVVFGYMGGLRPSKNVGMLIRAFAAMRRPPDRLALFGEGSQRAELEALARDLGAASQVVFLGHHKEVAPCYAAVDVYVSSSLSEQTSNALLEAMASKLPAVVTNIADNAILPCPAQRPFVIEPADLAGFTQALRTIAGNEELRRSFGEQNRQRCETEYSLDRMFRQYTSLWEEAERTAAS